MGEKRIPGNLIWDKPDPGVLSVGVFGGSCSGAGNAKGGGQGRGGGLCPHPVEWHRT